MLKASKPFTRQNLEATYVKRRRASWVEAEGRVAERSRDGFQKGVVRGMIGMALAGLTNGRFALNVEPVQPCKRIPTLEEYYRGRISPEEIQQLREGVRHQRRLAPRHADAPGGLAGHSL